MEKQVAWIGFGEAGSAFAEGLRLPNTIGFDRKTDDPIARDGKLADFARHHVVAAESLRAGVTHADAAVSLVTADQALAVAESAAPHLAAGTFWFDMNSVAPDTKRAAARVIAAAGARYVDVAVMAPVLPKRQAVPLLVAGPEADEAAALLRALGFAHVDVMAGGVGAASSVKMIRSVMIKGIEALSAECVLAADAAGVRDAVIASLDASWPGAGWAGRIDYNLDRMMLHGLRRAAEMEEVVFTIEALGTGASLSRATATRQRAIGQLGLVPPAGLAAKIDAIRPFTRSPEECAA